MAGRFRPDVRQGSAQQAEYDAEDAVNGLEEDPGDPLVLATRAQARATYAVAKWLGEIHAELENLKDRMSEQ